MAKRLIFIVYPLEKKEVEFEWNPGFSIVQKRKNIESLHKNAKKIGINKILEISSKSESQLGIQLSAFNLKIRTSKGRFHLENIFQSSKVFENGGPYNDILYLTSKDAKKDERLKSSGKLRYFKFDGEKWDLIPITAFYDYLYFNALLESNIDFDLLLEYEAFSDIEFNHKKSYNCQAEALSKFMNLYKNHKIPKKYFNEKSISKNNFFKLMNYDKKTKDTLNKTYLLF
ncbi:hypothetical protein OSSY52_19010 [Tepiditoga spiralis]|uniref:Uncharacterized protein n=1 Tax=Tepiditoga spiralis TaxID=2108365 RepID=A0A7G1G5B1_9BACT|nr:hypothetical protein [Tepiditoga spiralis]BBE31760.1 hypothetical protein OSSY52_19010 [Tepiditoga spiralis]